MLIFPASDRFFFKNLLLIHLSLVHASSIRILRNKNDYLFRNLFKIVEKINKTITRNSSTNTNKSSNSSKHMISHCIRLHKNKNRIICYFNLKSLNSEKIIIKLRIALNPFFKSLYFSQIGMPL